MPGSFRFRNSAFLTLWLLSCCQPLSGQIHKVDPQKTISFNVAGSTAAYSLDESIAEATAENGVVSVLGKQPGTTHVVVVAPAGMQTFEVLVTTPPPHYPPGFVMPLSVAESAQSGYYEGRYYSSPAEIQNQADFLKTDGLDWTHVHIVETSLVGATDQGQPRTALSSASYEIFKPGRDITLLDRYVDESPLTINGSIVRGFHMQQGDWFVHAGYTSVATFEGLFLPVQPELVVGGGYRYRLSRNSSLTASFYRIQVPASDRLGRSGNIGELKYRYSPRETFWFTAEVGISHGVGAAGRLFYKTDQDSVVALVRYMPPPFASLSANNFRGLHTDVAWTRHFTKKFDLALTFYNNNTVLPDLRESTVSGAANIRYLLTSHWAVTGGASGAIFQTSFQLGEPSVPVLRTFSLPTGLTFQSRHFGAAGQYQFAATPGQDSGGGQFRASLRSGWGAFSASAYAERDTNAPTLNFIFGQVAGLQQILNQLGIAATSVQQVDEVLSSNAYLIAAGYLKGASINLVPARDQIGGTGAWTSRGKHPKQLNYSFLFNDNHALQGSTEDIGHTLSFSERVSRADDFSLACSLSGVKNPGTARVYSPVCFVAWRHQLKHVPAFIVPERHGTITGRVFRDDQSSGVWEAGMSPLPEVDIVLDDRRHTLTRSDGTYAIPNVPRGKHRIAVDYRSRTPFFFTTRSEREVDENAAVDFGIGYSLSGLVGQVVNDAGEGVPSVTLTIRSGILKWSATTDAMGSFFVSALTAGEYTVQPDEDSLPPGYSTEGLAEPRTVTVGDSAPGKVAFTARALRNIAGRVLIYDARAGIYVGVAGAEVSLGEARPAAITDAAGRYLFRGLAAGTYAISVRSGERTASRTVRLGAAPVDLINVDFQIGP